MTCQTSVGCTHRDHCATAGRPRCCSTSWGTPGPGRWPGSEGGWASRMLHGPHWVEGIQQGTNRQLMHTSKLSESANQIGRLRLEDWGLKEDSDSWHSSRELCFTTSQQWEGESNHGYSAVLNWHFKPACARLYMASGELPLQSIYVYSQTCYTFASLATAYSFPIRGYIFWLLRLDHCYSTNMMLSC